MGRQKVSREKRQLFSRRCACENHVIFTENGTRSFSLRGRSFFSWRKSFSELIRRKLVDQNAATICTVCLEYAQKKIIERKEKMQNQNQSEIEFNTMAVELEEIDMNTTGSDQEIGMEELVEDNYNYDMTKRMHLLMKRLKVICRQKSDV